LSFRGDAKHRTTMCNCASGMTVENGMSADQARGAQRT
jgi:hypothetical protein